jgi:hypothetical protein
MVVLFDAETIYQLFKDNVMKETIKGMDLKRVNFQLFKAYRIMLSQNYNAYSWNKIGVIMNYL